MRMIVIKQGTDLQALGTRLLADPAAGGSAVTLDRLKHLNPHVDFGKINPGTVLLVPDGPGLRADAGSSVSGDTFASFSAQASAALDAATARVIAGHNARLAEQKDVAALFQSPALQRAIGSDDQLKAQVDAATQLFKQDQATAKAAADSLKALKDEAGAELAALGKLLG